LSASAFVIPVTQFRGKAEKVEAAVTLIYFPQSQSGVLGETTGAKAPHSAGTLIGSQPTCLLQAGTLRELSRFDRFEFMTSDLYFHCFE
jgi:hypothetical protein